MRHSDLFHAIALHAAFADGTCLGPMDVRIPPGLSAMVGGEQTGKTTLLRLINDQLLLSTTAAGGLPSERLDLDLPGLDAVTIRAFWDQCPVDPQADGLREQLVNAWSMAPHLDKRLDMLSKGHRRKAALVAHLCSPAPVICLDQPFAALDATSARALVNALKPWENAPERAVVIADYVAHPALDWQQVIELAHLS